jgi:uroporphyrinogen-III synthase
MKTLLITRPREETQGLARQLAERGFTVFSEPLLSIESVPEGITTLEAALKTKPQALLITSRRALDIIVAGGHGGLPVICVGAETARYAASKGFTCLGSGETARALPALAEKECVAARGPLLYLRAHDIRTDIAAELEGKGFTVESVTLYHARMAEELSEELRAALKAQAIAGALFFSARTAQAYVTLTFRYGLDNAHRFIDAIAISEAAAEKLDAMAWKDIHIAEKPDREYMIKTVEAVYLNR